MRRALRYLLLSIFLLTATKSLYAQLSAYMPRPTYADVDEVRRANITIRGLRSMADGEHFTKIRGKEIIRSPYTDHRKEEVLFRLPTEAADYQIAPNGESLLMAARNSVKPIYRHSYTADYYIVARSGESRCILEQARDATLSPNGEMIAYSQNNNLHLIDLHTYRQHSITTDGKWNAIINGTSDWVYEEEYGFTRAFAFSHDNKQLAYLRFDESRVPTFEMMRFDDKLYNAAYSFKYPKAGDTNSTVELWLYDIEKQTRRKIDVGTESDQYILNVAWTPANQLYFYRVNRLQNQFEVVLFDGEKCRTIYKEVSPTYVERPSASTIKFIDGTRFIVREETTTGWSHLYLHSIDKGRLNAITRGEFEVTSIVEASSSGVAYISTEESELRRDLYHIALNGRSKRRLTLLNGYHTIMPSAGMKYYIQTFSSSVCPNVVTIHKGSGLIIDTLADSRPKVNNTGAYARRQFHQFTTERGDKLNYYIQLPDAFDPSQRYPVLITQYSGPGSQSVADRWSIDWEAALTRYGYIVACCDGRGTGYRGEKFKKATYGNLGKLECEDQISFARHLASLPYVDGERLGIYGWSYGGFMALNTALHGDGLYKMAIAVAPVTSWRYYDTIYTEIYNGLPANNAAGYDDNSPLSHAAKLSPRTKLLIMHGTADDNVHFQNTMEMCRRLNAAGKQYDMMVYPDQNHSMMPAARVQIRQKMIDYTIDNL